MAKKRLSIALNVIKDNVYNKIYIGIYVILLKLFTFMIITRD